MRELARSLSLALCTAKHKPGSALWHSRYNCMGEMSGHVLKPLPRLNQTPPKWVLRHIVMADVWTICMTTLCLFCGWNLIDVSVKTLLLMNTKIPLNSMGKRGVEMDLHFAEHRSVRFCSALAKARGPVMNLQPVPVSVQIGCFKSFSFLCCPCFVYFGCIPAFCAHVKWRAEAAKAWLVNEKGNMLS